MRCEMMQMARMAIDERFGEEAGESFRRQESIRRRMRREREEQEDTDELDIVPD